MRFEKFPDHFAPMPTCTINVQPDGVATKLAIKVPQHLEKSLSVAKFGLDHSCTTQKRGYPSRNIQTLLMLAGRRDLQSLSDKRPATAKPRMQGKAAFVLKNNGFFKTQRFEFFLGSWQTSLRPRPLLGDRHGWLASNDTRADASNIGLDGPSVLSRTAAVNGSPVWGHPIGHGSIQTSGVIPPDGVPTALQSSASYGLDGPTAFSESGRLPRPYVPLLSSDLHSSGSGPEPLISSPAAAPPVPIRGWRSLCQPKLLVPSQLGPAIALWTLFLRLRGWFSYSQYNINRIIM
jgi:hypothetical protein